MTTSKQTLGTWGEELAVQYLLEKGYAILERNTRTPYGEIDLVACQALPRSQADRTADNSSEAVMVFVEVKTRRSAAYGLPEEAITPRKRQHLLAGAQAYLQSHPEWRGDWRIDVIAIQHRRGQAPNIQHFENAITEG